MDIAYCVGSHQRIEEPFNCDLGCKERFPNMTLIHQWYLDDSVCGYIAVTHSNIFLYNDTSDGSTRKTVVVSLRGTRSFSDLVADMHVGMVPYSNLRYSLPYCGDRCRIHKGFAASFANTLKSIDETLEKELLSSESYELVIVGHSMGGSVALLLALHYLDLGYHRVTLVTMGMPLVGNQEFTSWADYVLGSFMPIQHDSFQRKFIRVVHKRDIVTTIPKYGGTWLEKYAQFDNQIYLNVSSSEVTPLYRQVVDCFTGHNDLCIEGDKDHRSWGTLPPEYFENHNTYFRRLGRCGLPRIQLQ